MSMVKPNQDDSDNTLLGHAEARGETGVSFSGDEESLSQRRWLEFSAHSATILFGIGWVACAQFLPAPSPLLSPDEITRRYVDNVTGIRVGITLMLLSFAFWAIWGGIIAAWTRSVEPRRSMWAYVQLVSLTVSEMIGVLCAFFWGMAAFRPGEISPEITQAFNDMGWLMFLLPWPPFSMWCVAVGFAVLRDRSPQPMFPRWVAGLSFLTAFLFIPAFAPIFFKSSGFAYNGLLGMYLPLVIFFVWIEGVTYAMRRSLKRETQLHAARLCASDRASGLEVGHG